MAGSDRRVVEQAESHRVVGIGMVAGWAHECKAAFTGERPFNRIDRGTCGICGNFIGAGIDVGVGIDVSRNKLVLLKVPAGCRVIVKETEIFILPALPFEPCKVSRRVHADEIPAGCGNGIVDPDILRQAGPDRDKPGMAFGMSGTIMVPKYRAYDGRTGHRASPTTHILVRGYEDTGYGGMAGLPALHDAGAPQTSRFPPLPDRCAPCRNPALYRSFFAP